MNKGIVIETTGSWHQIKLDDGKLVQARLKGKLRLSELKVTNPITVGDRVIIGNEEDDESIVIQEILPRRNQIIRISPRKKRHYHIIAANIDQAIIVASMRMPKTKKGFISRLLVGLNYYDIPAILLFNKIDIYKPKDETLYQELKKDLEHIGVKTMRTSNETGEGIKELTSQLKNKLSVVTGSSGVGKSTLINSIDPDLNLKTNEVSRHNDKGQHTTTFARMHEIAPDSYIIDTPGIKEYGVANIDAFELSFYFPEIKAFQDECKFNNCQHLNEPKCAVKTALENGLITEWRYNSYVQIREELLIENKSYL